jgi:hypothetical protein
MKPIGYTSLSIAIEWGTLETVRISHPGSDAHCARFLIDGRMFARSEWNRIRSIAGGSSDHRMGLQRQPLPGHQLSFA